MAHCSRFAQAVLPALVVTILGFTVAVATGAIPSSDGRIHGCYNPKLGGALRVIDTEGGQSCRSFEQPIGWSQQGPPGPQGAQGEPGPAGGGSPFWAIVRGANGELFRGNKVASTVRHHAGSYSITFEESIPGQSGERPGCAVNVTPNATGRRLQHEYGRDAHYLHGQSDDRAYRNPSGRPDGRPEFLACRVVLAAAVVSAFSRQPA